MSRVVVRGNTEKRKTSFIVEFQENDKIFEEGDLGTEMYIIQSGKVAISKLVRGEEQILAVMEKGDFFGEMSILEDLPRSATARALEPVRVVEINGSTFGQMLIDNSEIAIRMMRKLSRRLRDADEYLKEMGGLDVIESRERPAVRDSERKLASHRLVSEVSGQEFFLSAERETTVGRKDPVTGIEPDIDLSPVDPQRSTSRRHAKIHRRAGKFFLTEEIGTTNGTFVGDTRLDTGAPFELRDGDPVRFGLVKMTFRT
jgi:CRP-like cAMP-binding protein